MRIIVCGGRDFTDRAAVFAALDRLHGRREVSLLIHGAARGADLLAEAWAKEREVNYLGMPARWKKEGRPAGPQRNERMANTRPVADMLVAFPGGSGTADMIAVAEGLGIKVWQPFKSRSY